MASALRQIGNKLSNSRLSLGTDSAAYYRATGGQRLYIYQEAMEGLVSRGYLKPWKSINYTLSPSPSWKSREKLEGKKEFVFKAKVEVLPEVKLGEYKGLQVERGRPDYR